MPKENVNYVLIDEQKSPRVEKLFKIYKKNPFAARVLYFNEPSGYQTSRLVLFERENGNFEITHFEKKFGISITNRIYSRETKVSSIIYKDKKFYLMNKKKFTQLTFNLLSNVILPFSNWNKVNEHKVVDILCEKFSWIRFIKENKILYTTAFNSFIRYKLYNLNDSLRHIFKLPTPVAKKLINNYRNHFLAYLF